MNRGYRKLVTKRGVYFVVWRPEDVAQLIKSERLDPVDFQSNKQQEMHYLIRDLYLLACKSAMNNHCRNEETSLLASYARKLHSSLNIRH